MHFSGTSLCVYLQVVPVLVTHLPVKEDEEEISTIYDCLLQLLQAGEPNVCYTPNFVIQCISVFSMYFREIFFI